MLLRKQRPTPFEKKVLGRRVLVDFGVFEQLQESGKVLKRA